MARARIGPAAALIDAGRSVVAACEENRLTRARYAPPPGPPVLARAELLSFLERMPTDVSAVGVVEDEGQIAWADGGANALEIGGHQAHAAYAFHASGFRSGLVLVSEVHKPRGWTAWRFEGPLSQPREVGESLGDFPLARIYGQLTEAIGLQPMRDEHLVEAMARSGPAANTEASDLITLTNDGVAVDPRFSEVVRLAIKSADPDRATRNVAASVQRRLGECLVELLKRIAALEPGGESPENLCLSGGLFFNTFFTTAAATGGIFSHVYVPPHPGRNGTALGAALLAGGSSLVTAKATGSPYLGPGYSDGQIKEALDNCKLSYDFVQGDRLNEAVIHALVRGRLIGWFHDRLEWGPRALGHRSVLANPFAPHVLENLNGFLKRRPWYRSYGVSVPRSQVNVLFDAHDSQASPFMQFEYRPRDPDKFRTILPKGVETLRVHTVDADEPRFLRLLEMWGQKAGLPVLVNTSFNGFHEPLVCSPRDAIRVFYGTGLDVLALGDFYLRK
jgi:carbamoyltransferase